VNPNEAADLALKEAAVQELAGEFADRIEALMT
jgi:hypothetical protein